MSGQDRTDDDGSTVSDRELDARIDVKLSPEEFPVSCGELIISCLSTFDVGDFDLIDAQASAESCFDDVGVIITPGIGGAVTAWDELGPGSAVKFVRYSLPFNVLG